MQLLYLFDKITGLADRGICMKRDFRPSPEASHLAAQDTLNKGGGRELKDDMLAQQDPKLQLGRGDTSQQGRGQQGPASGSLLSNTQCSHSQPGQRQSKTSAEKGCGGHILWHSSK